MDSREQLRIIISRFTSFTTRNLFKKKERERSSIKIPWTFFDSTYTRRTPLVPFNLVGKEARNRFEGDAKGFAMAQKFLSDIDFAEDLPRPLPVWRVSPSEIRDSIKPHPPDRGKKRARDRGRLWIGVNETNWPKKRARKHPKLSPMTRYAKPEFGIQPPLYLPLSSSPSSSLPLLLLLSRDQQSRRVFLRASKAGCTCYRFNYVRTCGPCAPCVLRSSPTLLSIANETRRNVVRSCKSLGGKARAETITFERTWELAVFAFEDERY